MALNLCYCDKKGLFKAQNYATGNYIMEHDEKGRNAPLHEQILEIPNRNVKIVVRTNLHYGSWSYMNATISMMDKKVLNFFDKTLLHSVKTVYAKPGNWDMLFDGIIQLYNSIYNSETQINAYFDEIIKRITDTSGITLDNMADIITRLAEVADSISSSIYIDNHTLESRMRETGGLVIRHIGTHYDKKDITEGRHDKMESNLHSILNYLIERDIVLDALTKRNLLGVEE